MGSLRLDPRERRTPEQTALYRVLADHLETLLRRSARCSGGSDALRAFLDRVDQDERRTLPRFVERELRAFSDCSGDPPEHARAGACPGAWLLPDDSTTLEPSVLY